MVAGFPCPPWSTIGSKEGCSDTRSEPFYQFLDILADQGQKGAFFFIMEMVPAQDHCHKGAFRSDHSFWVEALAQRAPMWKVQKQLLNSAQFGLPQNRERLYTIGHNCNIVPHEPRFPMPIKASMPTEDQWHNILHEGLESNREKHLSTQQKLNLVMAKEIELRRRPGPMFLVVSVDRNPRQAFGSYQRADGLTMTLRTANEMVWLLQVDSKGRTTLSRPVHPFERFGLQGFSAHMGEKLSKKASCHAGIVFF